MRVARRNKKIHLAQGSGLAREQRSIV